MGARVVDYLEQHPEDQGVRWSRVNAAEQYPGQVSPLSWSVQLRVGDETMRSVFHRMGLLRASELVSPPDPSNRFIAMRHGRLCANVDVLRDAMDRLPGDAGDALEEQLLGAKAASTRPRPQKRTLAVATHMPVALYTSIFKSPAAAKATKTWWQTWVKRIGAEGPSAARPALNDVPARQMNDAKVFGVAAFCQQAIHGMLYEALPENLRSLLFELPSGQIFPEGQFAIALWEYAQGKRSREAVVEDWGYFGSDGGDVVSASIRARPDMLEGLARAYASAQSPETNIHAAHAKRAALIDKILQDTPAKRRGNVKILLGLADRLALARERGRSAWLQSMDLARCAGAALGRDLCAKGQLREESDAFYLTAKELVSDTPENLDATVSYRRALAAWRETFALPNGFTGDPELLALESHDAGDADNDNGAPLSGMPAAAGVVRATARVVLSPFEIKEFQKGDILVCRFTDPSWTPIISLAGGIVADIGGALSHGAIIAREMGVPAVVNTRFGTKRIPDGATVEINGSTGEIVIVAQPAIRESGS